MHPDTGGGVTEIQIVNQANQVLIDHQEQRRSA